METIVDIFDKKQELVFIRKPTKKERNSSQSGFADIPVRAGYQRVFFAYRTEGSGRGYYYTKEIN